MALTERAQSKKRDESEALVNLLEKKGIIAKKELLEEIKRLKKEYLK